MLGRGALGGVLGATRHVCFACGHEADGAGRLGQRLHCHQAAANVGVLDDRRHSGAGAAGAAALPALPGIAERALGRALGDRHTLHADREAGRVHHDEHDVEATILLADEIADGALALLAKLHHAGRAGVDAELVLDAGADHVVMGAERAVVVDADLGHQEQGDAARARRRIGEASQNEMNDVVGQLVVAVGDEDLGAEQAIATVGLLHGAGFELAEVGAGVRLGQVHGAGPCARHHLGQIGLLQGVAGLRLDGIDGPKRQQRAQAKAHVGRIPDLAGDRGHDRRQVLPAPFLRRRERAPAAGGERLVGIPPARRRFHLAVDEFGAGLVARGAERIEHLRPELAGLLDDGTDGGLVDLADEPARNQLIEPGRALERLHDVIYGSLVGHGKSSRGKDVCALTPTAQ